ncbi:unnamed protein product, partial [Mesorhabditis belari]|uniref:Uncharacterized protein n=1 Tax=Mesorhabditis belari TaxID=2138241 RepID=A0AAF3JA14_9BILA
MATTHICGCSVICWCYVLLCFDAFLGLLFAMKHYDFNLFNLRDKADRSDFFHATDKCLDLGLGPIGVAAEMSLLVVVVLAFLGLCCRKSLLLLPYLIYKFLMICLTIYMIVQYIIHFDTCKKFLFAQVIGLVVSLLIYSIVAGAYRLIKYDYQEVDRRYP